MTLPPSEGAAALGWRGLRAASLRCTRRATPPSTREIKGLGHIVLNPGHPCPTTSASPTSVLSYKRRVSATSSAVSPALPVAAARWAVAPRGGGGWFAPPAPSPEPLHVTSPASRRSISLGRLAIRSGWWRCPASRRTRGHHDVEGTREKHRRPDRGQVRRKRQQSHAGGRAGLGLNGGHTGCNASWGQRGFPDRSDRSGLVFGWERMPMREARRLAACRAPRAPGGDCGAGAGPAAPAAAAFAAAGSGGVDGRGGGPGGREAGPVARGDRARHRPRVLRQEVSRCR